jgi:PLP dependent protein
MLSIRTNLERLRERIALACRNSGRKESEITLLAVTKGVEPVRILEAINCGVKEIGENRIQEAESKFSLLPQEARRHLVGHLQTNKVKKALELFDMIQSIDSLKLAREINHRSGKKKVPLLVEVNTSGEATKTGIRPQETLDFLQKSAELENLIILGLMTVGPLTDDQTVIRNSFHTLRNLFEQAACLNIPNCKMEYLSMGMSSDFEIAIQEGANLLRIGTAIFGPRN